MNDGSTEEVQQYKAFSLASLHA